MIFRRGQKRSARDRTRFGQDRLRQNVAELAEAGSVIAIAQGEGQEVNLILITTPKGGLADCNQLQGKILTKVAPNQFSTVNAETVTFHATRVRSPPLLGQKNSLMVSSVEEIVFVVDEYELNGLLNEYLM